MINTNFTEKEVVEKINILSPMYSTSVNEFKNRYYKMGDYDYNVETLIKYASERVDAARLRLNSYFKLGKLYRLDINMLDDSSKNIKGSVRINSILIDNDNSAIEKGIWRGTYYDGITTKETSNRVHQ